MHCIWAIIIVVGIIALAAWWFMKRRRHRYSNKGVVVGCVNTDDAKHKLDAFFRKMELDELAKNQ